MSKQAQNYKSQITKENIDRLDKLIDIMAYDDSITNNEYCELCEEIGRIFNELGY